MIDHFSPIGFLIKSEDHLMVLLKQAEEDAEVIPGKRGTYFRWSGSSGVELWLKGIAGTGLLAHPLISPVNHRCRSALRPG